MSEEEEAVVERDADEQIAELGIAEMSPEEQDEIKAAVDRLRVKMFGEDAAEEDAPEEDRFAPDTSEPPDTEEPVAEEVQPPEPPATPPPTLGESVIIDGREIPVGEVRSYIQLQEYLRTHPSKAEEVGRVLRGQEPAEEDRPITPPEGLDLEDPSSKILWDSFVALSDRLKATEKRSAAIAEAQTVTRAQSDFATGLHNFRTAHPELTEDDITTLRGYPLTIELVEYFGSRMKGEDAVFKALDLATLEHPTFRARQRGEATAAEKRATENKERKQKLSALSGSSGSVARTEPKPDLSTDQSMKKAAADALRGMVPGIN